MRKILLSTVLISSTLLVNLSAQTTQEEIDSTKAQIEALQASLVKLESSLPQNLEKAEAAKLAEQTKKNEFKTHTEFGYISTSGNTDTTSYGLDLDIKKNFDKHVFAFSLDAQYADDKNVETKNKYLGELSYDYELTDRFAFSYLLGYKEDKFSGYAYQMYTGPGAKYTLIQEEKHNLRLEGNVLYSQDDKEDIESASDGTVIDYPNPDGLISDPALLVKGETLDYASFRAKAVYEWQILESLKFTQDLSYRAEIEDTNNYFVYSKTALVNKLTDIFSLGLNYKVDYVNSPPESKAHSDKTFSASLIIDY